MAYGTVQRGSAAKTIPPVRSKLAPANAKLAPDNARLAPARPKPAFSRPQMAVAGLASARPELAQPVSRRRLLDWLRPHSGAGGASANSALERIFDRLAAIGKEISGEGRRVLGTSNQIATQSKQHSDGLRDSLVLIEQIRESATSTSSASTESQRKVVIARELVETCQSLALERASLIDELVQSVEGSRAAFQQIAGNVTEVERFVAIIQAIGTQTNLLALNAAIEAARAGVHGTGFLVVAREMRLLADRTGNATQQIRQMTERMQTSNRSADATIGQALTSSGRSREAGLQLNHALEAARQPLREAEANATAVAVEAQRQISGLTRLEADWNSMRRFAVTATLDADASAEMSMRTVGLAARFYEELADFGATVPLLTSDTALHAEWRRRRTQLATEEEACRENSGLHRLEELRPLIEAGMTDLKAECARRGQLSRRGAVQSGENLPQLCLGGRAINHSYELVDSVSKRIRLAATLFVKAEAEGTGARALFRVSTTVKRSDGTHATGTRLNPKGSVAERLLDGESVFGYAYILGLPHVAAYEPIRDAVGEVIGAMYVGISVQDKY
jgi:methyl-accepting chemotaxis protein